MFSKEVLSTMSQDPLGLSPDSNPYRYLANGPTDGTDPSGMGPWLNVPPGQDPPWGAVRVNGRWQMAVPGDNVPRGTLILPAGQTAPAGFIRIGNGVWQPPVTQSVRYQRATLGLGGTVSAAWQGTRQGVVNIGRGTVNAGEQFVYTSADLFVRTPTLLVTSAANEVLGTPVYVPNFNSALFRGAEAARRNGPMALADFQRDLAVDGATLGLTAIIRAAVSGDAEAAGNVAGGQIFALGMLGVQRVACPRLPPRFSQDINVNPTPPSALPLNRPIGASPTQNAAMQADIAAARAAGARDFRVDQQQVNAAGQRVGINRPDLQFTDANGRRVYVEYDTSTSTRGPTHRFRILANDPNGIVILRTVN